MVVAICVPRLATVDRPTLGQECRHHLSETGLQKAVKQALRRAGLEKQRICGVCARCARISRALEDIFHQGLLGIPFVLPTMIERHAETLGASSTDRLEFPTLFINR